MNTLPRIKSIVGLKDHEITVEWTTGEVRVIDFGPLLAKVASDANGMGMLRDPVVFSKVRVDPIARTLAWDGLASIEDAAGRVQPAPLDFCPDVLYQISRPAEVNACAEPASVR